MKPAYLLVNVLLVGAGLFAYDTLRAERPVPVTEPVPVVRAPEPAAEPAPEPLPGISLVGMGEEQIFERLDKMAKRLASLETQLKQQGRTRVIADSGDGAGTPAYGAPVSLDTLPQDEDGNPVFDAQEMAWFRALKEEVDRQVRMERYEDMIGRQIDRMEVSLSDEQREQVIAAAIDFRNSIRDSIRQLGDQPGETTREAREAAVAEVRENFSQTMYSLVPASDAEILLSQLGGYPGRGDVQRGTPFRGRRGDNGGR